MRASFDGDDAFERFRAVFNHPDTKSYYNKMTHYDMATNLPALLQVEDRVTMASSLESRVPLLDHRIADHVASMPPRLKFRGGELKHVLKRAIGDLLPAPALFKKRLTILHNEVFRKDRSICSWSYGSIPGGSLLALFWSMQAADALDAMQARRAQPTPVTTGAAGAP